MHLKNKYQSGSEYLDLIDHYFKIKANLHSTLSLLNEHMFLFNKQVKTLQLRYQSIS